MPRAAKYKFPLVNLNLSAARHDAVLSPDRPSNRPKHQWQTKEKSTAQISFNFDSPASVGVIPRSKSLIYCYNGKSEVFHHAMQLGRAVVSATICRTPAKLPEWAGLFYVDSSSKFTPRVTSFLKQCHLGWYTSTCA